MSDKKKRQGTHYLEVENQFILGGTAAVEALWLGGKVSRDTLRLTIKDLEKKAPNKVEALREWYQTTIGERSDHIQPGEERTYKAQLAKEKDKDGKVRDAARCFIRLPLPAEIKKGDPIRVRHSGPGESLGVTVTRGAATDEVHEQPEPEAATPAS